jgi:hypothetical protein
MILLFCFCSVVVVQWLKPSLQVRIHTSWVQICTLLQFSELHCTYHSAGLDSRNGVYELVAELWITFGLKLHRTRAYNISKFLNVLLLNVFFLNLTLHRATRRHMAPHGDTWRHMATQLQSKGLRCILLKKSKFFFSFSILSMQTSFCTFFIFASKKKTTYFYMDLLGLFFYL